MNIIIIIIQFYNSIIITDIMEQSSQKLIYFFHDMKFYLSDAV